MRFRIPSSFPQLKLSFEVSLFSVNKRNARSVFLSERYASGECQFEGLGTDGIEILIDFG